MYNFDIIYRAGEERIPVDARSRVKSRTLTIDASLCHPGTARMTHFDKSQNLHFTVEDEKHMTQLVRNVKSVNYFSPVHSHLIKVLCPM